jgi:hypothetical protein
MNMMAGGNQSDDSMLAHWLGAELPVFIETDDALEAADATPYLVLKEAPVGIEPNEDAPVVATFDVGALGAQDGLSGWPATLDRDGQAQLQPGKTYAGQVLIELAGGAGFYTELFWIKVRAPLKVRP